MKQDDCYDCHVAHEEAGIEDGCPEHSVYPEEHVCVVIYVDFKNKTVIGRRSVNAA